MVRVEGGIVVMILFVYVSWVQWFQFVFDEVLKVVLYVEGFQMVGVGDLYDSAYDRVYFRGVVFIGEDGDPVVFVERFYCFRCWSGLSGWFLWWLWIF